MSENDLMFDLDISLFCVQHVHLIMRYSNCSHVSVKFQCIHTCIISLSFPDWGDYCSPKDRTTVDVRVESIHTRHQLM